MWLAPPSAMHYLCHSLSVSGPQLLLWCPGVSNTYHASHCADVLHGHPCAWVTTHNHAVMRMLLTHSADEEGEW